MFLGAQHTARLQDCKDPLQEYDSKTAKCHFGLAPVNTTAVTTTSIKKQNVTRAVLHMGMYKTGTTTIQSYTNSLRENLRNDGYEMPWSWGIDHHDGKSVRKGLAEIQSDFARCFLKERAHKMFGLCRPDLVEYGREIAREGKNLLVSAENFLGLQEAEGLKKLQEYLSQWDEVRILIFYRRFYDWIPSMHNEQMKQKIPRSRIDIVQFLKSDYTQESPHFPFWYGLTAVPMVERLKDYFSMEDITIRNYHEDREDGKLSERFFCEGLPQAPSTCEDLSRQQESRRRNSGADLQVYRFLTEGARRAKLLNHVPNREIERDIAKNLRIYWESTLNFTSAELPRVCPPQHILDAIWKMTLHSEKMFREYAGLKNTDGFDSEKSNSKMRLDFEKASRTSLCSLDVDRILEDERWLSYFKSLQSSAK